MKTSSLVVLVVSGAGLLLLPFLSQTHRKKTIVRASETTRARVDSVQSAVPLVPVESKPVKAPSEQPQAVPHKTLPSAAPPPLQAVLATGFSTLQEGVLVYSPDAILQFGDNVIASPDGIMVSDPTGKMIQGSLILMTPKATIQSDDAFVNGATGEVTLKSPTIRTGNITIEGSEATVNLTGGRMTVSGPDLMASVNHLSKKN